MEEYNYWVRGNSIVMTSYLINVNVKFNDMVLCRKSAKDMWDQLAQIYSHSENPIKEYNSK